MVEFTLTRQCIFLSCFITEIYPAVVFTKVTEKDCRFIKLVELLQDKMYYMTFLIRVGIS